MGLSCETLFRVECCHFGQSRIVVYADMRVGGNLPVFIFLELVGQAQEVGVGMAFQYIHSEQRRSGYP